MGTRLDTISVIIQLIEKLKKISTDYIIILAVFDTKKSFSEVEVELWIQTNESATSYATIGSTPLCHQQCHQQCRLHSP